jgi:DNA-3-methyladenine glycosylase
MWAARPAAKRDRDLCSGPAKLCQAFGIDRDQDGVDLVDGDDVRVLDDGVAPPVDPGISRRIGITLAVDEPWRWFVPGDPNLSRPG